MSARDTFVGAVLGATAVLVGRALLGSLPAGSQPIARAVSRGGIILGEKIREAAAELGEVVEDTVAEMNARSSASVEPGQDESAAHAAGDSVPPQPSTATSREADPGAGGQAAAWAVGAPAATGSKDEPRDDPPRDA